MRLFGALKRFRVLFQYIQTKKEVIVNMNRVILIGFLGKDAEAKTTRNNAAFTVFSVATSRRWKNHETGEYESQK